MAVGLQTGPVSVRLYSEFKVEIPERTEVPHPEAQRRDASPSGVGERRLSFSEGRFSRLICRMKFWL